MLCDCFDCDHGDIPQQTTRNMHLGIPSLPIPSFFAGVPPSSHPLQRLGSMDILGSHWPINRDNETGI